MAEPPPTPPDDDDDGAPERPAAVAERAAPPPTPAPAEKGLSKPASEDDPVIYRARKTRADIVKNVIVGVILSAMVGAFLFEITDHSKYTGAVFGAVLALLGARYRKEQDELTPSTIVPAHERKRAVELHFEDGPSLLVDSQSAKHVDAEATGDSREGFTHWIVFRREGAKDFRVRARDRAEAIAASKRLRVLLEVPPLHPLGDDELGGEDYPPPSP